MKAIVDSMLRISIEDLEPFEYDFILEDNEYKNPEYHNAYRMGRSTRFIKKTITTYTLTENEIIIPRGYKHQLDQGQCDFDYQTTKAPANIPPLDVIVLRPYQNKAVNTSLEHDQGIIQAGTGSGKIHDAVIVNPT